MRPTPGLRKSASTSKVRSPNCAKVTARLAAAVVLPSRGRALDTRMTCGGCSACDKSNAVRKARKASDIWDLGRCWATSSKPFSCPLEEMPFNSLDRDLLLPFNWVKAGTTAREGRRAKVSTSSGLLTVLSMYSRKRAKVMPPTKPTRKDKTTLRVLAGRDG